ncbi:MAG: hypothetical protein QOG21_2047 [Actinomycetota bacterium]|nr:hypothetical protein [Actinomycetota bacterium]
MTSSTRQHRQRRWEAGAINVHEFMSLDGVIDAPTWTSDYGFDPKIGEAIGAAMEGSGASCSGAPLTRCSSRGGRRGPSRMTQERRSSTTPRSTSFQPLSPRRPNTVMIPGPGESEKGSESASGELRFPPAIYSRSRARLLSNGDLSSRPSASFVAVGRRHEGSAPHPHSLVPKRD